MFRGAANHQGSDSNYTDDEKESDSDIYAGIDQMVYFNDLDQKLKGTNINYVGKLKGLSKEKQDDLKGRDYSSDDGDEIPG